MSRPVFGARRVLPRSPYWTRIRERFVVAYVGDPKLMSRDVLRGIFGRRAQVRTATSIAGLVLLLDHCLPDLIVVDGRAVPNATAMLRWVRGQRRLDETTLATIVDVDDPVVDDLEAMVSLVRAGVDHVLDPVFGHAALVHRLVALRPDAPSEHRN